MALVFAAICLVEMPENGSDALDWEPAHQAFKAGDMEGAALHLEAILRLHPTSSQAWLRLGHCRLRQGLAEDAFSAYEQAEKHGGKTPAIVAAQAHVLQKLGRLKESGERLERAVVLHPSDRVLRNLLAAFYSANGQLVHSLHTAMKTGRLYPEHPDAWTVQGDCGFKLGEPEAAEMAYTTAMRLGGVPRLVHCLYHPKISGIMLRAYSQRFITSMRSGDFSRSGARKLSRSPNSKIVVSVLSSDFRKSAIACFLEPLFLLNNSKNFKVLFYNDNHESDAQTEGFRERSGDRWRNVSDKDDRALSEMLNRDATDILLDISGLWSTKRLDLLGSHSQWIRASWLGYPATTGMDSKAFRISDTWIDPEGTSESFYTESLFRMREGCHSYCPPQIPPPPRHPGSRSNGDSLVFGCFANLAKINNDLLRDWQEILRRVENAKLLIKSPEFACSSVRERFRDRCVQEGIASERLEIVPPLPDWMDHMELHRRIDIMLDTFPYNGTTGTCESFLMGVPVVSRSSEVPQSRVGGSLLRQIGLGHLATTTGEDYVDAAVALAQDHKRRQSIADSLTRDFTKIPLGNPKLFAPRLETALRDIAFI